MPFNHIASNRLTTTTTATAVTNKQSEKKKEAEKVENTKKRKSKEKKKEKQRNLTAVYTFGITNNTAESVATTTMGQIITSEAEKAV